MSDLILSYDTLTVPPVACTESPPESSRVRDGCYFNLGFVDDSNPAATPRVVRFDRVGDQFVLSSSNSDAVRGWFESHTNTLAIFDAVRLTSAMLRGFPRDFSAESMRVLFVISQFISTGEVRTSPRGEVSLDRSEMANALLYIFTENAEEVLGPVLGQLQVARRSSWLSDEGVERIRWVTSILDLVPSYRLMRGAFIDEAELDRWASLPVDRRNYLDELMSYLRFVIIADAADLPLRFSQDLLTAHDAYVELYENDIEAGRRPEFCAALAQSLETLRGERGGATTFISDCREALRLRDLNPETALRESLSGSLLESAGLRAMQEAIAEESAEANMSLEWLLQRDEAEHGRIGEILSAVFRHIEVRYPEDAEALPTLHMDVAALRLELTTLFDANASTRREYLLAALAVLRRLFGRDGAAPAARVFVRDAFQEVSWDFSDEELAQLRRFIEGVESSRVASHEASDLWLPVLEGAVCAVGIGGLFATELAPELRGDEDLHLGLGTTSAGLTGLGCSSLMGHFFWPEIGEVHNRYLWEGLTGLGGALVGIGIYLLAQFLNPNPPPNPGMRFPVDEYGP